jgi:hypothetical protein
MTEAQEERPPAQIDENRSHHRGADLQANTLVHDSKKEHEKYGLC